MARRIIEECDFCNFDVTEQGEHLATFAIQVTGNSTVAQRDACPRCTPLIFRHLCNLGFAFTNRGLTPVDTYEEFIK